MRTRFDPNSHLCSTVFADKRTFFTVKYPVCIKKNDSGKKALVLNRDLFVKMYPFLESANLRFLSQKRVQLTRKFKDPKTTREHQKRVYLELLQSKKVKNRADIARKFGVSRTWVSKVLNS